MRDGAEVRKCALPRNWMGFQAEILTVKLGGNRSVNEQLLSRNQNYITESFFKSFNIYKSSCVWNFFTNAVES